MARDDIFYQFEDLGNPKTNIRLLTVIGDDFNAPLRSSLQLASFEDQPKYVALSYVWGSSTTKRHLQITNRILKIQPNVFDALRRFRAIFGTFVIWIDAICINQSDLEERSIQVTIMRRIYESADTVLVYLGENEKSQELGDLFTSLMEFGPRLRKSEDTRIAWDSLSKYGLPEPSSSRWQHLIQFLSHPWFSRVWIFQESLVARKSIFFQGECSINQVDLFALLYELVKVHKFHHYVDRTPRMRQSPMESAAERCLSISTAQGPIAINLLPQIWIRQPLIKLLRENIGAEATDPRDHIYALLGVSKEAEEPELKPDYEESVENLYKRLGKYMAENGFLPLLLECTSNSNPIDWPSWIPRWHEPGSHTLVIERQMRMSTLFSAAGQSIQDFRWQPDHTLLTRGVIVDEITHLGSDRLIVNSLEQLESSETLFRRALNGLIETFFMFCPRHPYINGEPKSSVLCRLSVCDQIYKRSQKAPECFQEDLGTFLNVTKAALRQQYLQQGDTRLERMYLDISMMLKSMPELPLRNEEMSFLEVTEFLLASEQYFGRCIRYSTRRGYIGQVNPVVKMGDEIALLQGCDVPLILRPTSNGAYTYVNTCYLHGIMYGEAWNDEDISTIRII